MLLIQDQSQTHFGQPSGAGWNAVLIGNDFEAFTFFG
jgi:hypothetical protein